MPNGVGLAESGEICLGTVDSWLLWNLTGGDAFCCDYSNAARTQLFNLHTANWDDEMLALFGIPRQALPEIRPSSGLFGYTHKCAGIPDGIPVMRQFLPEHVSFQPDMARHGRLQKRWHEWQSAVELTRLQTAPL